jgi:hypothetical protein
MKLHLGLHGYSTVVWHIESKESFVKVCVMRYEIRYRESCYKNCVYCAVRPEALNIILLTLVFKGRAMAQVS